MKWFRQASVYVPTLVLIVVLGLRGLDPAGLLTDFRTIVFDYYQRISPRTFQDTPVRVIDIDDESLERIGLQWPWPRPVVAEMVAQIANAGAAAIVFDIVFAEPDRTSPGQVAKLWEKITGAEDIAQRLADLPDHDAMLADILGQAKNAVTGFVLTEEKNDRKPRLRAGFATAGDNPRPFLQGDFHGTVPTLPAFEAAAAGNGSFNFHPGRDLVVRTVPLLFQLNGQLLPSIVAEALRVAQNARSYVVRSSGASGQTAFGAATGINSIKIGNYEVPTTADGQILIHFTPPEAKRYVSAWKLLTGEFDPALVEGNIVLIGTSAAGLRDIRPSPINPVMPGVEAHAQAIEQVLLGHYLQRPDWSEGLEWVFTLVLGLGLIALLAHGGALSTALFGGGAILLAFGLSWYGYSVHALLVDPVSPSLAGFLIYLSGSLIGYMRTETEKRQVRGVFSRYVSPALVEQLAAHPERVKLGGETRIMTFLFCDIRGFTAVSEQFKGNPQGLTKLINRFLTPMTNVILDRRGTIDKYMGDCIMAFWNAPLDDAEHADHACASALRMFERLKQLNATLEAEAKAASKPFVPINIGVGLNTGECVVGNMGSKQRYDYSVLGDAVNLASRLEGQSKTYGVGIVVGESTREAARSGWAMLELDLIAVKGKTEAVRIFALLGDATKAADTAFQKLQADHNAMLAAYRRQDWDAAEAAIRVQSQVHPELEDLYDLYMERIGEYRANPPGENWTGVYIATSK